jgi:hypothetical protein
LENSLFLDILLNFHLVSKDEYILSNDSTVYFNQKYFVRQVNIHRIGYSNEVWGIRGQLPPEAFEK